VDLKTHGWKRKVYVLKFMLTITYNNSIFVRTIKQLQQHNNNYTIRCKWFFRPCSMSNRRTFICQYSVQFSDEWSIFSKKKYIKNSFKSPRIHYDYMHTSRSTMFIILYIIHLYTSRHRRAFKQCVFINIPSVSPPPSCRTHKHKPP
jgi:hypothetical protein